MARQAVARVRKYNKTFSINNVPLSALAVSNITSFHGGFIARGARALFLHAQKNLILQNAPQRNITYNNVPRVTRSVILLNREHTHMHTAALNSLSCFSRAAPFSRGVQFLRVKENEISRAPRHRYSSK